MDRDRDLFKQKEHGEEQQYFRRKDEELIQKLRERARLADISKALAEKLEVDNPAMLARIVALGVTLETAPAFLMAPLVQIAWAEGTVHPQEREMILRVAHERGIEEGSPANAQLLEWLAKRPPDALFETSEAAIRIGVSVLPPAERDERIRAMVALCRRVAGASGGEGLARLLGLSDGASAEEEAVLQAISAKLTGG